MAIASNNTDSTNHLVLRAYWVLRIAFTAVPVIAGIDQFTNKLTNWDMYLAPQATSIVPIPVHTLMMISGVIEIIAGLLVAFVPRIGGWLVAIWLWLIVINLLLAGGFYDNVLRDLGLSLGAVALALLSEGLRRGRPSAQPPQPLSA
ncbi:MAG: hypothetical protein IT161_00140 [Bryobacterales bacterium]|nr:hypothetical protein [Bryobacterales bacterium]